MRVAAEMDAFFGVTIDPKNWTRDWLGLWESLKEVIKEVDIQAQQPLWQVIYWEKIEKRHNQLGMTAFRAYFFP